MTAFLVSAGVLTLAIVLWLIWPLLRQKNSSPVSEVQLNAAVHRDQLAALKADLDKGLIKPDDYEASVDELQMRLLDDTQSYKAKPAHSTPTFWSPRKTALLVGLCLPLLAIPLYLRLGSLSAIDPVATAQVTDQQIRQMVDTLAAKLQANPDNPKGWAMLAKSYKVMGRFEESRAAFERIGALLDNDPELLVDYADVLAVLANNQIEGRPLALVNKALAINPRHPMGLMMSGVAAYRRADFLMAIQQWETLLSMLEPGSGDARQIEDNITAARNNANLSAQNKPASTPSNMMPPVAADAANGMTTDMINQMVERLAKRLESNPQDIQGWARLARAYKVQGRLAEAIKAYEKTGSLMDSDADLLSQYADTLATQANSLQGKPRDLIKKALTINPQHPNALMMAGQGAFEAGSFQLAIGHWEKALQVLPANSPDHNLVQKEIQDAKNRLQKP